MILSLEKGIALKEKWKQISWTWKYIRVCSYMMLCLFLLLRSRCGESRTLQGEKFAILKCISLACGLYWAGNNQDSGRIFDLPADCWNTFRLESLFPEWSFPGGASGREPTHQCRRCKRRGFDPWVGKIPWRRKWQPTPVFLPRASHGQRSLVGYSPWGHKDSDTTEATEHTHTHTHTHTLLRIELVPEICDKGLDVASFLCWNLSYINISIYYILYTIG